MPLIFTPAASTSRLFGHAPSQVMDAFATQAVTDNYHHNGISPKSFDCPLLFLRFARSFFPITKDYPALRNFFEILTINFDRQGVPFVSTVEAKSGVPVFAVQWHPERAIFEV